MPKSKYDIVLIGGGIMSATLGTFLREFDPNLKIALYERLDQPAKESSSAWNNAGTGHSGFCELNYTPIKKDGTIDISKPYEIAQEFELSKQFWSYLLDKKYINSPRDFINSCPHFALVWGDKDADFLKRRFETMQKSHLFRQMEFSDDHEQLKEWIPLIMRQRAADERMAATRMPLGTDVNFGAITKKLVDHLDKGTDVDVNYNHEVKKIKKNGKGWQVFLKDRKSGNKFSVEADFVFIGAGGYALPLLQSTGIKEQKGYGGFPVSGQFLVTDDPEIVAQHKAKVYTQAAVGAPPMSVPHLDRRVIDGKDYLLFGPFAGFSSKYLKTGSYWDLFGSIKWSNIRSMLGVAVHSMSLLKYLIGQVMMTEKQRVDHLRDFVKDAPYDKWHLEIAGQRVQIIKKDAKQGGKLQFGTEVVTNAEGTLSSLLGASPGASTAVFAILTVLEKCFADKMKGEWHDKLMEMIPSYGTQLKDAPELTEKIRDFTKEKLELDY